MSPNKSGFPYFIKRSAKFELHRPGESKCSFGRFFLWCLALFLPAFSLEGKSAPEKPDVYALLLNSIRRTIVFIDGLFCF